MTLHALLLLALAAGTPDGGQPDAPYALRLTVGSSVAICNTGTIVCPAASPRCDDPSIAVGVLSEEGVVFKALKPGTTLCSAAPIGVGARRVYRVVVE